MASVRFESGSVCSAKAWQVKIMVWNCIRLPLGLQPYAFAFAGWMCEISLD